MILVTTELKDHSTFTEINAGGMAIHTWSSHLPEADIFPQ